MPLNSYQNTSIPSVVTYITPTFDTQILSSAKSKEDLNRHILVQTQGEPVILSEDMDIASLMYITNVIYTSSPELVFVTKEGLKIQIFDFTSEPVIRSADISTAFALLNKEAVIAGSTASLHIDIKALWEKQIASNPEQRLYNCVQDILKQLKTATKTTLVGKEPAVLFLLAQHYLSGKTKELWYQEDANSKPVRIY